jgi:hypothetical protein
MYFTSAMNLLSFVSKKEKKKKMGSIVVYMGNHDKIDYSANKKSSMRREPVPRIHLFPLLMLFVFFILWAGSTGAQFFRLERFPIPQSVGLAWSVFMFFFFGVFGVLIWLRFVGVCRDLAGGRGCNFGAFRDRNGDSKEVLHVAAAQGFQRRDFAPQ